MSEIAISGASKRYGASLALDNVSLTIPAGSRTAIVGASGSGKTTLLRAIAGFEHLDGGRIALGDTLLAEGAHSVPAHRRDIGYVVQEGALFPHMSVADNVAFGMRGRRGDRQAQVMNLILRVGLPPDVAGRRPHQLSGGQQQRVALARAMARAPKVMLLDEPFSALDTGLREAMRDMVAAVLGEAGITTVLVTHDQSEALSFADHVVVMREGRVAQAGSPQQLYLQPADSQTARFLGDAVILSATVADGMAHTLLGALPVAGAPGQATVMLRPEQLSIELAGDGTGGTRARVLSRRYEGSLWRVVLEHVASATGDGVLQTASVFTVSVPGTMILPVGSVVRVVAQGPVHRLR